MEQDNKKFEQILVNITGQDRPGLTAMVTEILARHKAQILDIGQADIHATLSLGILIRIDERQSGQVMKELLFKATELQVQIAFTPIGDDEYEAWVNKQGKKPLHPHPDRQDAHRRADCLSHQNHRAAGAQHRLDTAPHRTPEHQEDQPQREGLHRVLAAWHAPRPKGNAGRPHAHVGRHGYRLFIPKGQHVQTHAPTDML